jgi:hypothetical protein
MKADRNSSPLASSMMAPALLQIQNEFEGTSSMVMNFAISIYVSTLLD